ncbi:MAG: lipopolysaccharide biosynthesis protein [Betaproteobacteria bacterium]|nr:lipopolysaccharide biosynthesis protein [Betaproteobacteria bacterium]
MDDEDEISLLDLAIVLAKHKRRVAALTAGAAVLALIVSLLLPKIYTGTTRILPPQQAQSTASAMMAQLGGLAGLAGAAAGIKNPNDLYVGMLKSRTVADALIQRFQLQSVYDTKLLSETRKTLANRTTVSAGKDGIITIEVEDRDPKRAADLANGYVEELYKLTQVLAVTDASQRRLFFERQLSQARENLAHAEAAARTAVAQGGVASVDATGRSLIAVTARLRGEIAAKQVQIAAMRSFATDQNPDLKVAQQELAALQSELGRIEGNSKGGPASEASAAGDTRGAGNLALLRDVKYYETLDEMLTKQYELAKIDEAKDAALIQVMDHALVPDRKTKPKRALIVILSALAGLFAGILWAFLAEAAERARQQPETAARLQTFKEALRWRKR